MSRHRPKMLPFQTTLLGVVKGVLDFYGSTVTTPFLYGASGHAFLINIHPTLCPSGPYCWNRSRFDELLQNTGVAMVHRGFFTAESSAADHARIEAEIREALDLGVPCSLCNLEHQVITDYDEKGFTVAQPWAPHSDFPPARLTFGSWQELGKDVHISFYTFRQTPEAPLREAAQASFQYAVDLWRNPSNFAWPGYGIGPDAYRNWIAGVEEHGAGHGNWWNARVWSECRRMAAAYCAELATALPESAAILTDLSTRYTQIADHLTQVGEKERDWREKVPMLENARDTEAEIVEILETGFPFR